MGNKTGIEWRDATWNPIRGCSAGALLDGQEYKQLPEVAHDRTAHVS